MSQKISSEELVRIYAQPGLGYTDEGLAKRLDVGRDAIFKRRKKLSLEYPFKQTGRGRWRIDIEKLISQVPVSQNEALVLYLATRRFSRNTPLAKRYVQEALEKLALALYQPMTEKLVKAASNVPDHPDAERREQILNELMRAWSEKSVIRIKYHALKGKETIWHEVSPYLIEPSPWSDSVYVVGYSNTTETIIPFSIERIEKAMLTSAPFKDCAPDEEEKLLQYAWGIWRSDKGPERVKLRFTGRRAVRRLRESIWHPDQEIDGPEDGSYATWEAPIAEWREMLPWIRGWGADVEVLHPPPLREALKREARRLAEKYGWTVYKDGGSRHDSLLPLDSPVRLLWAKTDRDEDQDYSVHPLICHLIDVAQVVCALWDHALPLATRRYFTDTLNMDEATTRQWLAFLAGLHDLGKASPTFQGLYQPYRDHLKSYGFDFPDTAKIPHGWVSAWALKRLFAEQIGLRGESRHNLAVAIGGHHGTWPTAQELTKATGPGQRGEGIWVQIRTDLFTILAQVLKLTNLTGLSLPEDEEAGNVFCMALAGLISVADWLGSMIGFFPFVSKEVNLAAYAEEAYQQASRALDQLGWTGWSPPTQPLPFSQLFPFRPRPLQEATVSLADRALPSPPALVIIEAPTGEGKTEAAWYLADRWLTHHQQRGVYVAMPTQATSNQMLGRVRQFIEQRYPDQRTTLLLLHGDAVWSEDMRQLRLAAINENEASTVAAHTWFLPKKRSLLATFAVGTVDQALLATLQTRHFFVRLFGLSHKTVIFDEIHAYDTYMNVLFQRLLRWLAVMGSSVILLSATLPAKTRRQLIEAYTGRPFDKGVNYPAIIWSTGKASGVISLKPAAPRTVSIDWLDPTPEIIVNQLRQRLPGGGCIAFICNTVGRAQTVYRMLREANLVPEEDLILFHARFPFYLRQQIENEVLNRFGKTGERPKQSIVVATQVIEQSLDLDFDLMITELAPIDLILQRIGRLHRHRLDTRPGSLQQPCLLIIRPALEEGVPQFGLDSFIYAPYILLRSYLALQQQATITVPDEVQALIEAVYGSDEAVHEELSPAWQAALAEAQAKLEEEITKQELMAELNLILPPGDEDIFRQESRELAEDQPNLHTALQALTRMARPSVTLVCLHQTSQGLALDPDGQHLITLEETVDWETTRQLATRKVTISNWDVIKHFANQEPPISWQSQAMLCHYRPAIFEAGRCELNEKVSLIFDQKQGIIIQKER